METIPVDALDVAHAMSSELAFDTGLLPAGTLWWRNTRSGPITAIYVAPKIWKVAIDRGVKKRPQRFQIPLPGLIFLCSPSKAPWVFAVKSKPTKETDIVYKAPVANVFANGRSCPGTHKYPNRVQDMVDAFFVSYFTATADLGNRSVMFPENIIHQWEFLNKKKLFPADDLVPHATVKDLMKMVMD